LESLQYYKGCVRVTSCLVYSFFVIVIKVIYIKVTVNNNLNCAVV